MDRRSKEFQKLKSEWYKKLEQTGFDDIESNEDMLKDWHSTHFKGRQKEADIEAQAQYFELAGQFLHSYRFDSKKEQAIWEYHAEGLSIRDIVSIMKRRRFKVYKSMVHTTVQRLRREMINYNE